MYNSRRKYLDKHFSAFFEETESDADISLDNVMPSVFNNVVNHIQTIPRVTNTWINQDNNQEQVKFECSINFDNMYSNYLKKSKKYKKKVNKKQYKKIYNTYLTKTFM